MPVLNWTPFYYSKGTRQGCPLLTLLLALTIEPLPQQIQGHPDVSDVGIAGYHHKLRLFANDFLHGVYLFIF